MADEFVVAEESYGSGTLARQYKFSAENGKLQKTTGDKHASLASVKQFFKVLWAI